MVYPLEIIVNTKNLVVSIMSMGNLFLKIGKPVPKIGKARKKQQDTCPIHLRLDAWDLVHLLSL